MIHTIFGQVLVYALKPERANNMKNKILSGICNLLGGALVVRRLLPGSSASGSPAYQAGWSRALVFGLIMLLIGVPAMIIGLATQPFVSAVPSRSPEVSPDKLQAHVKHLSVDLYPRSYDRLSNIDAAAQYIVNELKTIGAEVTIQEVVVQKTKYQNIVAHFGPSSGPLIVIGAHYDSYGDAIEGAKHAQGYSTKTHTPGADDNASGVAGLLELARLLHQNQPRHAVDLVAYTLEEPPNYDTANMGSVWHAHSLIVAGREVRLMLSLEMIGYFSDKPGSQSFPLPGMNLFYPDTGSFITVVGRLSDFTAMRNTKALMAGATDLPVYSMNAPSLVEGVDFSDHRSYWSEGFTALMVTDTAFYRNKSYHLSGDTFDKLDYHRMAKVVQSVYAVAENY